MLVIFHPGRDAGLEATLSARNWTMTNSSAAGMVWVDVSPRGADLVRGGDSGALAYASKQVEDGAFLNFASASQVISLQDTLQRALAYTIAY